LDGRIDAVLDGGATAVGVESTVVGPDPEDEYGMLVYRPGGVTMAMLERVGGAGMFAPFRVGNLGEFRPEGLPSPGVGMRHYAPRARLVLVGGIAAGAFSRRRGRLEGALVEAIDSACDGDTVVGVMLPDGWDASCASVVYRWGAWGDAEVLARRLFAGLRELDDAGATVIVCPVPEMGGLGEAIRDRLEKAARG
jgi:L-threonylcarbamoyladenylate synthase